MGFRHSQPDRQTAQRGEAQQPDEDRTPAGQFHQVTAEQGRHQGGEHGHQVHQRQHPGCLLQGKEITHDGPPQHRGRRAPQGLQATPQEQLISTRRQCTTNAGHDIQRDAAEQQGATTKAIGQRSVEQHADA
ncbi:hypothetical protein D9M68_767950 [compost metagenome]